VQLDLDEGTAMCAKSRACANNGNVCGWMLRFHDPDGDFPTTRDALYARTRAAVEGGEAASAFDVDASQLAAGRVGLFGCFDEADFEPTAAFRIEDEAGRVSNVLCVSGSGP